MKILITRLRQRSLSGCLYETIIDKINNDVNCNHNVYHLDKDFDITDVNTYPNDIGEYDAIFNCSGITLNQSVLEHGKRDAQKVFNVNVIGAMNLTKVYAKARINKSLNIGGAIIHVGSTGSRKVFTNCSAYCASKAALAHYIQCAGYELKKYNISVIGVHPGNLLGTQMTRDVQFDLVGNRGMSTEQVEKIYEEAHDTYDVAKFMQSLLDMPLKDMTGENFYLGQGWKG